MLRITLLAACIIPWAVHAEEERSFLVGKITGLYIGMVAIQRECARVLPVGSPILGAFDAWVARNEPVVTAEMEKRIKAGATSGAEWRRQRDEALAVAEQRLTEILRADPKRAICRETALRLQSGELDIAVLFPDEVRALGPPPPSR